MTSALTAAASGFLQTSTVTLAPRYGPGAIASYMAGSALSAVGVSVLQLVTASTSTSIELPNMGSASWSATICFAVSAILLVLTLISYRAMVATDRRQEPFDDTKDTCIESPIISEHTRLLGQPSHLPLPPVPQLNIMEDPGARYGYDFSVFYAGVITLVSYSAEPSCLHWILTSMI